MKLNIWIAILAGGRRVKRVCCASLVLILFGGQGSVAAENEPDPVRLLQGVEAMREKMPASRLLLRAGYKNALVDNIADYSILVDRERRYYAVTNSADEVRIHYNGTEVSRYDGKNAVIIRDLDTLTADYLFDPRLLGLTVTLSWGATIGTALPYRRALSVELVGREPIRDKIAWHVRVIDLHRQLDLWIDDLNGFRVYRIAEKADYEGAGVATVESFYEDDRFPWIPSRVEGIGRKADGTVMKRRKIEVLKAEAGVEIPEETWTLAGLRPSRGSQVTDVRSQAHLGYWDGEKLCSGTPGEMDPPRPPR